MYIRPFLSLKFIHTFFTDFNEFHLIYDPYLCDYDMLRRRFFIQSTAYIGDIFGTKQIGAIHGYILTAWALAGIVGPILLSFIYDRTNSYNTTMIIFGCMFVLVFS